MCIRDRHKQGRYYIVHFKELFALDGKGTNISENDVSRRNSIASLLSDWGLVEIIGDSEPKAPLSQIKVISFKDEKSGSDITVIPAENYKLTTMVDFGTKILGTQNASIESLSDFKNDISKCRTFRNQASKS